MEKLKEQSDASSRQSNQCFYPPMPTTLGDEMSINILSPGTVALLTVALGTFLCRAFPTVQSLHILAVPVKLTSLAFVAVRVTTKFVCPSCLCYSLLGSDFDCISSFQVQVLLTSAVLAAQHYQLNHTFLIEPTHHHLLEH